MTSVAHCVQDFKCGIYCEMHSQNCVWKRKGTYLISWNISALERLELYPTINLIVRYIKILGIFLKVLFRYPSCKYYLSCMLSSSSSSSSSLSPTIPRFYGNIGEIFPTALSHWYYSKDTWILFVHVIHFHSSSNDPKVLIFLHVLFLFLPFLHLSFLFSISPSFSIYDFNLWIFFLP